MIAYILLTGVVQFNMVSYQVEESKGFAIIVVQRQHGVEGSISVRWKTNDKTAVSTNDYTGGDGQITFEHGEVQEIMIQGK